MIQPRLETQDHCAKHADEIVRVYDESLEVAIQRKIKGRNNGVGPKQANVNFTGVVK